MCVYGQPIALPPHDRAGLCADVGLATGFQARGETAEVSKSTFEPSWTTGQPREGSNLCWCAHIVNAGLKT